MRWLLTQVLGPTAPDFDRWANWLRATPELSHPTDTAAGLLVQVAALTLLEGEVPPDLRRLMAGAFDGWIAYFERQRAFAPARMVPTQDAARLAASLVVGAPWGQALVDLSRSLALRADGTSAEPMGRALEAALLARACCATQRIAVPATLDATLRSGVTAAALLGAGASSSEPGLFSDDTPSLWDGAVAQGLLPDEGEAAPVGILGPGTVGPVEPSKAWRVRSLRAGETAVAHRTRKGALTQFRQVGLSSAWWVDGEALLRPGEPVGRLTQARGEERVVVLRGEWQGQERHCRLEGDRVVLEHTSAKPIRLELHFAYELSKTDKGWRAGALDIRADEGPSWRARGDRLLAEGRHFRVRMELR